MSMDENTQAVLAMDNFARLLAQENIIVERAKVSTASFNLHDRILQVPNYEGMAKAVQIVFLSHEAAHAIWTPAEYSDFARKNGGSLINIVEDARIERLIKRKFPGIRADYFEGYKIMFDEEFFGTTDINKINRYSFPDRLNVFCKTGNDSIQFSAEEQVLVNKVMSTQTWEEVTALTLEVKAFIASKKQKVKDAKKVSPVESENEETVSAGDEEEELDLGALADALKQITEQPDEQSDEEEDDPKENLFGGFEATPSETKPEEVDSADEVVQEPAIDEDERSAQDEIVTDQAIEDKAKGMVSQKSILYANVVKMKPEQFVVPYEEVMSNVKTIMAERTKSYGWTPRKIDDGKYAAAEKVASLMAKEFEMRKAAEVSKRTCHYKSGSLDMNKIWGYQIKDDLFKRFTEVKEGKSHGLIMLVDWSGSMNSVIDGVLYQAMLLSMFAKKVSIPFRVYAFSDPVLRTAKDLVAGYDHTSSKGAWHDTTPNAMSPRNFNLLEIFSNEMRPHEFKSMANIVMTRQLKSVYSMRGTPFHHSLMGMDCIIPEFKNRYGISKVSLVALTDGASDTLTTKAGYPHDVVILRDKNASYTSLPQAKAAGVSGSFHELMARWLKQKYDINYIYYYLLTSFSDSYIRDALNCAVPFDQCTNDGYNRLVDIISDIKSSGSYSGVASRTDFPSIDVMVFLRQQTKRYFIELDINGQPLESEADDIIDAEIKDSATGADIAASFGKAMGSRRKNAVFVRDLIKAIA